MSDSQIISYKFTINKLKLYETGEDTGKKL